MPEILEMILWDVSCQALHTDIIPKRMNIILLEGQADLNLKILQTF